MARIVIVLIVLLILTNVGLRNSQSTLCRRWGSMNRGVPLVTIGVVATAITAP